MRKLWPWIARTAPPRGALSAIPFDSTRGFDALARPRRYGTVSGSTSNPSGSRKASSSNFTGKYPSLG